MSKKIVEQLEIATGRNREDKAWKNIKITWSALVNKLSEPFRSHETIKQYWSMKKDQRDQIKDIGGFVGGYLVGGRRKKGSVSYRTLVTLDADEANTDMWLRFQLLYDCNACLYSTHSHLPDKPRYRLVVPLDRPVEPEMYQPIARRIAGDIGIEQFDNTGFQDERLMYWPSCSKDAEYVFEAQEGPYLCVSEVLGSYTNWRDISEWPVSDRVSELILRSQKKQGDPLEKKGIIGAFCRTYSISEVINKYLNKIYEKTDTEDRFTYTGGSTACGVVIYDDKFAYSHHNTDPCSGKLCNAFDLVRLHLYSEDDIGVDPDTPVDQLPSFEAMKVLATQDVEVRKMIGVERMEAAIAEFGGIMPEDEEIDLEWYGKLEIDEKGNFKPLINNVVTILENDRFLKGSIAYDEFRHQTVIMRPMPWHKEGYSNLFSDNDEANVRWYVENAYGINSPGKVKDAIEVIMARYRFHPVREYLKSLDWDGDFRVDTLLIDFFGAEDNEYTRTVMRKTLVAAVARIFNPGCKFDYMTVLKGAQGFRKSTFWAVLGGDWFSDTFTTMQGKEAYEQLQGSWIIEVAELAGMRRGEIETIKHFIDKRKDNFRAAYGRHIGEYKRQCILVGTTNEDRFLRDTTGNRKFWVVPVFKRISSKELKLLEQMRDQIWAEAVCRYYGGETLYMTGEIEQMAKEVQSAHMETDDRAPMIREYLKKPLPENWGVMNVWQRREYLNGNETYADGVDDRKYVTAFDIYMECLGGQAKDFSLRVAREINDIMRTMEGWEYTRIKRDGTVFRGFVRTSRSLESLIDEKLNN